MPRAHSTKIGDAPAWSRTRNARPPTRDWSRLQQLQEIGKAALEVTTIILACTAALGAFAVVVMFLLANTGTCPPPPDGAASFCHALHFPASAWPFIGVGLAALALLTLTAWAWPRKIQEAR